MAKNGYKFARLWAGDTRDYGGDDSRADLALISMLLFWTGGNVDRADGLFRESGLMREKWDREDYRERTFEYAMAGGVK
jgi:primase-polymerase (primpol)-like protein